MGDKADAKYQFNSIVDIDFNESIESAERFQESVASVANSFQQISAATKDMNLKVADLVEAEFKKWDAEGVNTKDAARELINNIETKMVKKLLTRQVRLIDENSKEVLQVPLTGTFKAAMEKNIKNAYLGLIETTEFKFKPAKIVLRSEDLDIIQKKFEAQLNLALKHKVDWDLPKEPMKLTINKEHMSTLLKNFEGKLLKLLATDDFINFAEGKDLPKLNLTGKINDLMTHLKTTFASIDSSFEIDTKQLKQLPDFQNSLNSFRENLRTVIGEIIAVNKQINDMKVPADTKSLKGLKESLKLLQNNVVSAATDFVTQVNNEVSALPMGTVELAQYASVIGKLDQVVHEHIVARIGALSDELLASLGVTKISTDKEASIFTASLETLQARIREAVRGAAENLSGGKYNLDTTAINETFEQWSTLIETQLNERAMVAIAEITKDLLMAQDKIFNSLVVVADKVTEAIVASNPKVTKTQANEIAKKIQASILPLVEGALVNITNKINVADSVGEIKVPDYTEQAEILMSKIGGVVKESVSTWAPPKIVNLDLDMSAIVLPIKDALNTLLAEIGRAVSSDILSGLNLTPSIETAPTVPAKRSLSYDQIETPELLSRVWPEVYHQASNLESLKNKDGGYSFKRYDNAISFGRNMDEIMSVPQYEDIAGTEGLLKARIEGKGLDYANAAHRKFIDSLRDEILKVDLSHLLSDKPYTKPKLGDSFERVDLGNPEKVRLQKLMLLNALRERGIDWIDNFSIDAPGGFQHTGAFGSVGSGFRDKELHVLNPDRVRIEGVEEKVLSDFEKMKLDYYKQMKNYFSKYNELDSFNEKHGFYKDGTYDKSVLGDSDALNAYYGALKRFKEEQSFLSEKKDKGLTYRIPRKLSAETARIYSLMNGDIDPADIITSTNTSSSMDLNRLVNVVKEKLQDSILKGLGADLKIELPTQKIREVMEVKLSEAITKAVELIDLSGLKVKVPSVKKVLPERLEEGILASISNTNFDFKLPISVIKAAIKEKLQESILHSIRTANIIASPLILELPINKVDLAEVQKAITKADTRPIKYSINTFTRNYIKEVSASIIAQSADNVLAKDFAAANKEQLSKALQPLNAMMTQYIKAISETVNAADLKGMFLFKTANLLPEVVQELARKKEMSTRDFRRDFKTLEGEESLKGIMRENIAYIMRQFHEAVQESTMSSLKGYKEALQAVEIQPDFTAVRYMEQRMVGLQQEIVRKIKKLLTEQFTAMAKEIRQMQIAPMSIGYTPSKAVVASMSASARPAAFNVPQSPSYRPAYGDGGRFGSTSVLGQKMTPGGDTHSFMGSIVNTIRYITAGSLFMIPYTLINEALTSVKEFDYQLQKAQQNIIMKNPDMKEVAEVVIDRKYEKGDISKEDYSDDRTRRELVENEAAKLRNMAKDGVIKPLQDIALLYGLNQQEIGQAWLVATRRLDNPYESLNLTKAVGKIMSYEGEETDPESVATGLESIASQWQLTGDDMGRVSDMLIKTAAMSQTTVNDVLETEKRAGAMFKDNMRGLTKDEGLATSFALASLFTQATAREGNIGGTFYKTVLDSYARPKTLKYLEGMAGNPGFEKLSPYKNVEIPEGQEGKLHVTQKRELKSFTEFLTDFTDTLLKVDDPTRKELMFNVFPNRHAGSASAIMSALDELKEAEKRLGESGENSLGNYIKKIQDVKAEDIYSMMVSMQDTWKFKGQRAQTMWQVASFGVMENYKDEFDVVITYLTSFLRRVRDNSSMVTDVLSLLSKLAVAAGVKWLANKGTQLDLRNRYEKASFALMEEGRMLNLKQAVTGERLAQVQGRSNELGQRKESISQKLALATAERETLQAEYATARDRHEELVARHNELRKPVQEYHKTNVALSDARVELARLEASGSSPKMIEGQKTKIINLETGLNRLRPYVDEMEVVKEGLHPSKTTAHELKGKLKAKDSQIDNLSKLEADLDAQTGKLQKKFDLLNNELNENGLAMGNLQNRSQLLGAAFNEMGLQGGKFSGVLGNLSNQYTAGALKIEQYDAQIKNLAQSSGLSSKQLDLMRNKINLLNDQISAGTISTSKYIQEMRMMELEVARMSSGIIPQGTSASGMAGAGLVGLIAAQSLLMKNATLKDKAGVLQGKAGNMLQTVREQGALATAGAAGAWLGKQGLKGVGQVGKGIGKGASLLGRGALGTMGSLLKASPGMLILTAALDILGDAAGSRTLNDYERKQVNADKIKDMVDLVNGIENSESGLGKIVGGALFGYKAITGSISHALGGSAPSLGEYWKAFMASKSKNGIDYQRYMEENFDWQAKKREALVAQMKHDDEVMKEHPDWIRINEQIMKIGDVYSVEDAQALMTEINNSLSALLQEIATKETTNTSSLLMKGFYEDSPEVMAETLQKLVDNISAYSEAIAEINLRIEQMKEAQGDSFQFNPAGKELLKERDKLQAELKSAELEKFNLQYTVPLNRTLRVLEQEKSLAQYQWGIKRNNLLINGASEDSPTVKALEKASMLAQNKSLQKAIGDLQKQLSEQAGEKQRNEILLKISQLQYEQTENLVKIRQLMKSSMATFNLPSGIKPLTYYEAMTERNTHKNVTVSSGDVNINITIGKDVNTKDAERIASAVGKEVNKQLANQNVAVSRDIKAGLGYGYLGNYGIY